MALGTRLLALKSPAARRSGPDAGASAHAERAAVPPGWRGGDRLVAWAGAALALVVAVALFSRFSIDDTLRRDEGIYTYGGQQLLHGVPFYVSIFDPKTPLAAMLAGFGALLARLLGTGDVHTIRVVFAGFACLAVVAVYLLGLALWRSPLAGIVSAVVFASFKGFALDAVGGPDAKTPGIFLAVLAMALLVRRRWFWGAFTGSLAFLVWQPLVIYAAIAVAGALIVSHRRDRRRNGALALAGAALPAAAITLYYGLAGALPAFVEAAFRFPLTGLERGHLTLVERFDVVARTVNDYYGRTSVLVWAGLVLLVVSLVVRLVHGRRDLRRALEDPYVSVVVASLLPLAAFSMSDFQGYPDLYPMLPYAAIGIGEAVSLVLARSVGLRPRAVATAGALIAVAALFAVSWVWYSGHSARDTGLVAQRGDAAMIERLLDPGENLYALGDPTPLVLTGRRNPSRYIYLGSGVAKWAVDHTPGGFAGWKARIRASHPTVIVVAGWSSNGPYALETRQWLRSTYTGGYVGNWLLYMKAAVRDRAARRGIVFHRSPRAPG